MRKLYLVVDVQNDFVTGSLGFKKAERVVAAIEKKLLNLRADDALIFTRDTHHEDYLQTQEGLHLPVEHCIKGTKGWEIVDALQPYVSRAEQIFDKPTFGSHELGVYLHNNSFDEIEIMGLVSNICVISNAVIAKAALPEARIVVDRMCTSSADEKLDAETMNVMEGFQVEIIGNI
ncbi:cysteine hydrolase [Erysipelothrix sp. HDW6C]|uniref:cysteine hydrolase family protein n=1 Tax=Erysipelothrix sp. HDW6C TaxID=2714930 RepID=UPI001407F982|nr:isochorismatase family cysteine hydrolase [Erysipelothrix sp. HDW6C]QIK69874.1 cysteine hydrolase [Erysipelothrix sp. HDW6C]